MNSCSECGEGANPYFPLYMLVFAHDTCRVSMPICGDCMRDYGVKYLKSLGLEVFP